MPSPEKRDSVSSRRTPLVSGSQTASRPEHTEVVTAYRRKVRGLPTEAVRERKVEETSRLVTQLVAVARLTALALAQPGCSSLLTTQGRLPSPGANPAR